MKYLITLAICLFSTAPYIFCQQAKLSGKIIDSKSNEAIAFVHIGIPSQGIGTVSSENGTFTFNFPLDFLDDELEISHLGYFSQRYQLSELDLEEEFIIRLKPQLNLLEEVEIVSTEQPLVYYIDKAIKNLNKNYPNKLHYMTGFYRQATINRETKDYMRVLEAAVDIQDPGVYKPSSNIKLKVKELRKSDDLRPVNFRNERLERQFGKRNELFKIVSRSEIRSHKEMSQYKKFGSIFSAMLKNPDSLSLKGVTYYDDRKVYIIELNHRFKSGIIYLDSKDYGIYKITMTFIPRLKKKYGPGFKERDYDSFAQYRRVNGQYQLSLIRAVNIGDILDSEKGKKYTFAYEFTTLLINKFYTNKKEFDRIKSRVAIKNTEQKMFELDYPYNESFWSSFNIIDLEPINPKVKNDLEFKESLEAQYRKNGQ